MARVFTDDQRKRWNDYQRAYRAANPDKAKKWHEDYIMRQAVKLAAERAAERAAAEREEGGANA